MKRVLLVAVLALVLVLALSSLALAAPGDNAGKGHPAGLKGQSGLYFHQDGNTYDNPGQLFQALREVKGLNPAEWAKSSSTGNAETVGEWLYVRAADPKGDY
jgi:hypothetical protein